MRPNEADAGDGCLAVRLAVAAGVQDGARVHGEVVALHGERGVLREDERVDDGGFAHVLRGPVFMHGQTEDRRTLLKSWP